MEEGPTFGILVRKLNRVCFGEPLRRQRYRTRREVGVRMWGLVVQRMEKRPGLSRFPRSDGGINSGDWWTYLLHRSHSLQSRLANEEASCTKLGTHGEMEFDRNVWTAWLCHRLPLGKCLSFPLSDRPTKSNNILLLSVWGLHALGDDDEWFTLYATCSNVFLLGPEADQPTAIHMMSACEKRARRDVTFEVNCLRTSDHQGADR